MFRVEAIVSEPTGLPPDEIIARNYLKIAYDSNNGDVDVHNSHLTRYGFRVCSLKTCPIEEADMLHADSVLQGNMTVVDGKPVVAEDISDAREPNVS